MSPELIVKPPLLRSKFSFLFGCIAELYRFHYGEKRSTKFDDIKSAVEEMKKDEKISEYLSVNLESVFSKYPWALCLADCSLMYSTSLILRMCLSEGWDPRHLHL